MATRFSLEPPADARAPTMCLRQVGHELGAYGTPRSVVAYVSALQTEFGFPEPLPLLWRGTLHKRPHERSRWPRAAVEKWLFDRLPPDAAAHANARERDDAATAMDANAAALFGSNVVNFPKPEAA